jgi:hypothetical protein
MRVTRAYERVCGMERAHGIVADAWRKHVWDKKLLRPEDTDKDPVAKALFAVMEKIDAAKRPDDDLWRTYRYPPTDVALHARAFTPQPTETPMNPIDVTPLLRRLDDGTLARGVWTGRDALGRETACVLVALYPAVGNGNYDACPADQLPGWLVRLIPWMDDAGSSEAHPDLMRRLAATLQRLHVLDEAALRRCDLRCRRAALVEARGVAGTSLVVVDRALGLIDRAIAGDEPAQEEWALASAAATAASWATWPTTARRAATATAATAATAAWAAWAAAETAAAWAAAEMAATADRMIAAMLDAIDGEIASFRGGETE